MVSEDEEFRRAENPAPRLSSAVTATIKIYGARTATATNGVLVATITLSGTTTAVDAATPSLAVYPYYYVVFENITGTGATVRAEVFY